jgi:hypothetical protein
MDKIQVRKDYQHPYYHEYIIISTRSGHTFRIDRRPDPDAPFDAIMKIGCAAHDTIQELNSVSLKKLDSMSCCVVELRWQDKKGIDLLFVLSICFAIHNDKWAHRYTLQRYNCYFFSSAIIIITMRKSAVFRGAFNRGEVQGGVGGRELALALERELEWALGRELALELDLTWQPAEALERKLALEQTSALGALARDLARELAWEVGALARELGWKVAQVLARTRTGELAGEPAGELAGELAAELMKEVMFQPMRELAQELVAELTGKLVHELKMLMVLERGLVWQKRQELLVQARALACVRAWDWWVGKKGGTVREMAPEWALEWANGLAQIPLLLQSSKRPAFAKVVSPMQVYFLILLLWVLIGSNIARRT